MHLPSVRVLLQNGVWCIDYVLILHRAASLSILVDKESFVYFENHLVGLVVKASASKAEGPGFESRLRRDIFGVESYQWLQNWHSSGCPARRLAL